MPPQVRVVALLYTKEIHVLALVFFTWFWFCVCISGTMGISSQDSSFYSAFVAIGAVHIILGLFLYAAFTEDTSKPTDLKAE